MEKAREVVTPKAKSRYVRKLAGLGIPSPVTNITIDGVSRVYYPFYVALLRKGVKQRANAVDAVHGKIRKNLSDVLTRNLSFLLESVR